VRAPEKTHCTLFGKVHKKQMVGFVINICFFFIGWERLTKTLGPISNHFLLLITTGVLVVEPT